MYRIYSALIEIVAAAVFIIPIWCIYNKLCFHSWKRTIIYMVFGFYFTAVLALVGFPNIASLKIDFAVNVIPFLDMVSDFVNACLNILLFVPFGFFLPILWDKFRNIKNIALMYDCLYRNMPPFFFSVHTLFLPFTLLINDHLIRLHYKMFRKSDP